MGILDFNAEQASSNNSRRSNTNADKPQAKIWLNIGYMQNGRFVNLPVGLPIDTMEPAKVNGQEDWAKFQTARNALLKALQQAGDQLEPGAEKEIPQLTIQIRKVSEAVQVDAESNEYAVDLSSLFAPKVA